MRIGILTFHRSINYGAYMQALSLSHEIQKRFPAAEVEIIDYDSEIMQNNYRVRFNKGMLRLPREYFNKMLRKKAFIESLKYLPLSPETIIDNGSEKVFRYIKDRYDIVIVGSDAVWNWVKRGFPNPYILDIPGITKLSYAASASNMPMKYVTEEYRERFGSSLSGFSFISVRDDYTKQFVLHCCPEADVREVCDPTAFLDIGYVEKLLGTSKERFKEEFYLKHRLGTNVRLIGVMGTNRGLVKKLREKYKGTHKIVSMFGMTGEEDIHLPDINPLEWSLIFSMFDLTLSSFFHGVMLSFRNSTPCIAVDLTQFGKTNRNKIEDIMTKMDMADCFFNIEEAQYFQWDTVLAKAEELLVDSSMRNKIENNLQSVAFSSNVFFEKLAELLSAEVELLPDVPMIKKAPSFIPNDTYSCTGCGLCVEKCPEKAIAMTEENGFFVPRINDERCISCGLCNRVCPLKASKEKRIPKSVFAAAAKNEELLLRSSSGGVAGALSEKIIQSGGTVFGAAFDKNMKLRHTAARTCGELVAFHGSKYLQSDMGGIYGELETELRKGVPVLFIGTPCQASAVKSYFGEKYDNLYLVDFICSGVQSPILFKGFVKQLEKESQSKVKDIQFRDKRRGWKNKTIRIDFADGTEKTIPAEKCDYYQLFHCMRNSCYSCRYRDGNHSADITLGDYWKIEKFTDRFDLKKGVSALLIRTKKGQRMFDEIGNDFDIFESSYDEILSCQKKLTSSEAKPKYRDSVMEAVSKAGYSRAVSLYRRKTLPYRIKTYLKKKL